MSTHADINQIELSIEQAREKIKLRDQARKLISNREYKSLITKGYLTDEAIRLTSLTGVDSQRDNRSEIFDMLKAISHFQQYMQRVIREGDMVEQELEDLQMTLEELEQEEQNGDA